MSFETVPTAVCATLSHGPLPRTTLVEQAAERSGASQVAIEREIDRLVTLGVLRLDVSTIPDRDAAEQAYESCKMDRERKKLLHRPPPVTVVETLSFAVGE